MRRSRTASRSASRAVPGAAPAPHVGLLARTTVGVLMFAAVSSLSGCMTVQGADDPGEGGTA
ncbi:hypothetical protein, partial [Streptomyces albus]